MDYLKTLKDLLFLDIETVSAYETYDQLDERLRPLWDRKSFYIDQGSDKTSLYYEKAGIFAEFGKIVTISLGFFFQEKNELCFKVKSFCGHDEISILNDFNTLVSKKLNPEKITFCAHNGKEFDYPYLCRRMIINNIRLPEVLKTWGKKPWEIKHMDTLDMWKFGDRKNYTSLELLATVLGIPSSKGDFDGSMVNTIYYKENNVEKIARYCERDVVVTAQVYLKLMGMSLLKKENILSFNPASVDARS
jgi:predicted PolB exonuclease-like 3'-5' exonuclease